ncbi:hypothetical protein AKO1_014504 [Acrasis kona]|uniref:Uncharacterized protein n=1 Tax=Acrasis kona TaxID=1008807 RepID=A0AAW2Z420_9EUKA
MNFDKRLVVVKDNGQEQTKKHPYVMNGLYVRPVKAYTYAITQVLSALMGVSMLLGSIFLLIGSAIALSNLWLGGCFFITTFSLYTTAAVFGAASTIGIVSKTSRSSYQVINGLANILVAAGSIVNIIGSGLWFIGSVKTHSASGTHFIVGSSLTFVGFCFRNYAAVNDIFVIFGPRVWIDFLGLVEA